MKIKCAAAPARAGGYTVLELITVVVIVGILASLALPSFGSLVLNERRTSVVYDLLKTLRLARSEAGKRGRAVVICGVDDADADGRLEPHELRCAGQDWTDGWVIGNWADRDGNSVVGPGELAVLHTFQTSGPVSVRAGNFTNTPGVMPAGTILIKSFGRRTSNGTITVCDRRGAAAARAVIVSPLGRARVSSTRADGTPLRCP